MKVGEKIRYSSFAIRHVAAALAAGLIGAAPASAQPYPSRTVSLVVGYAPRGTGDFAARPLAVRLAPLSGRTGAVEIPAGAEGGLAAKRGASRSPQDHSP